MLHHIQTTMARMPRHTDTRRLQALAADAERPLRAQQHVSLEHERGQLRALVTDLSQTPVELTQRVQRIERVIAVLHANLAAARQSLALILSRGI